MFSRNMVASLVAIPLMFISLSAWGQNTGVGDEAPEFRTWTDITGSYQVEATLIGFADGQAQLKKHNGQVVAVPASKLSRTDQQYIRDELKRRRTATTPGSTSGSQPQTSGVSWPGWRGPNRDGKSPDTGLLKQWPPEGPPRLWHAAGIGEGWATASVVADTVYVTGKIGNDLVLTALDSDGNAKWKVPVGPAFTKSYPGSRSAPTVDEGNLYLVTGQGQIVCCDANTGRGKWTASMSDFGGKVPNWGYAESVLIYNDLAIVTPGGANCIVALDKQTGRPKWSSQGTNAAAQYSSCIALEHEGTPLIVNGTHGGIIGVDASNGRVLWSNPFSAGNTANCPTPAYSDGYVFWANGYGKGGICLKLGPRGATANQAWTTSDMVSHHGGYIIHEGHIYGNNDNSGWSCLELISGRTVWQERGVGKGSLCFADGMLYLFGEKGGRVGLATCSPDGFQMRGEFSVQGDGPSWAHPVVIGGRLYIRYSDNLYCYDVRAKN